MPVLRSSFLIAAAAAVVALLGPADSAFADPTAELTSSPAQRCLFPAADDRVKPVYPPEMYERKRGTTVDAEFEFDAPDARPRVRIEGDQDRKSVV